MCTEFNLSNQFENQGQPKRGRFSSVKNKQRRGNESIPRGENPQRGMSILNKDKNLYLREASERTQKTTFNQLKNIQKYEKEYTHKHLGENLDKANQIENRSKNQAIKVKYHILTNILSIE